MTTDDFMPKPYKNSSAEGLVSCSAPSNIALVKYWGKHPNQIPANPSISFTLENCKTQTNLRFQKNNQSSWSFEVFLEGKSTEAFKPKIQTFFERIQKYVPFIRHYDFIIETTNSFPHSSGIASSASGFSALAYALMQIEKILSPDMDRGFFNKKASFLSRLGSGSACRSIEGDLIVWGQHPLIENSSDLYGIKYPNHVHKNFRNFHDTILLVDKGEKKVSSSIGHGLMHNHPYAKARFTQATDNLSKLIAVFDSGDLEMFIEIVESEALSLHAMMMSSNPYYLLMKSNTLNIINAIWDFRKQTGIAVCFTLDAGANVHMLYPDFAAEPVRAFIETELVKFCQNEHYIHDKLGLGAKLL